MGEYLEGHRSIVHVLYSFVPEALELRSEGRRKVVIVVIFFPRTNFRRYEVLFKRNKRQHHELFNKLKLERRPADAKM